MKTTLFRSTSLGLCFVIGVAGCSPDEASSSGGGVPPSTNAPSADERAAHDMADDVSSDSEDVQQSAMKKMTAALTDFSPEDRQSAIKQHFCPVSDEMLGTMGAPLKTDVNGKAVWICCTGCKDKLVAEPDKYLAKLVKLGVTPPNMH